MVFNRILRLLFLKASRADTCFLTLYSCDIAPIRLMTGIDGPSHNDITY